MSSNTIEVKHIFNLSTNYINRYFSTVGQINKIYKDDNTRIVTIEFKNKNSVPRAFKFEGRIIDKKSVKIRIIEPLDSKNSRTKNKEKINKQDKFQQMQEQSFESVILKQKKQHVQKHSIHTTLWHFIHNNLQGHFELYETQRILLAIYLFRIIQSKCQQISHLIKFKVNKRYLPQQEFFEKALNYKLKQIIKEHSARESTISLVERSQEQKQRFIKICEQIDYSNNLQQEGHTQYWHKVSELEKFLIILCPSIGVLYQMLNHNCLIYNPEQYSLSQFQGINLQQLIEKTRISPENNFYGFLENVGARNIFFDFLNYQSQNSLVYFDRKFPQNEPIYFCCTLLLKNIQGMTMPFLSFCDFYESQISQIWYPGGLKRCILKKQQKLDHIAFGKYNLIFQKSHFSLEDIYKNTKVYTKIKSNRDTPQVFIIGQPPNSQPLNNQNHQVQQQTYMKQVYNSTNINIYNEQTYSSSSSSSEISSSSSQETPIYQSIIPVIYIQMNPKCTILLNQLKLEHYLISYIDKNVIGRGQIIASEQIALKLAENIVQLEKQHGLYGFGKNQYINYVGSQLWRLYNMAKKRRIKILSQNYQKKDKAAS